MKIILYSQSGWINENKIKSKIFESWLVRVFELMDNLINYSWQYEVRIIEGLLGLEPGIYLIEIKVNETVRIEEIIL